MYLELYFGDFSQLLINVLG